MGKWQNMLEYDKQKGFLKTTLKRNSQNGKTCHSKTWKWSWIEAETCKQLISNKEKHLVSVISNQALLIRLLEG